MAPPPRARSPPTSGSGICARGGVVRMRALAGRTRGDRAVAGLHARLVRRVRRLARGAALPSEQRRTVAAPEPAQTAARQAQHNPPPTAPVEPPAALARHRIAVAASGLRLVVRGALAPSCHLVRDYNRQRLALATPPSP